jgi:hypothetical protein
MKKRTNYFKKVIGLIMLGFVIYTGVMIMDEVLIEEIEDFIHDLSPIVVDDGTYFELDDFLLGLTMETSLAYSAIRIIEGIFRKEEKKES